jgi:hypothetical protein
MPAKESYFTLSLSSFSFPLSLSIPPLTPSIHLNLLPTLAQSSYVLIQPHQYSLLNELALERKLKKPPNHSAKLQANPKGQRK